MKYFNLLLILLGSLVVSFAQSNFSFSNPDFERLLKGDFNVTDFEKRLITSNMDLTVYLQKSINKDSLSDYLRHIVSFKNRNTVSDDSLQSDKGIRGARNYIQTRLNYWNSLPNTVLISSEFSFDFTMCSRTRHTQLMSFIPGNGNQKNEVVIVEAHLDSRCEDRCNIECLAEGAEDNGSGSALIMELARVLSKVELNRSVLIIWITGEEQGLGGSTSFATYCKTNGIKIKAVFNNDIVGGIECGKTSSPPSCPGPMQYDSTHLRIFSSGTTNSMPKSLARLTKLIYDSDPNIRKTSVIDIMFSEDRTGRGSDHIPFRENGYASIRFTSSYEHGDGNPDQPGYEDRQHSSRDVLGKDINGDGMLDSFYVDFQYLVNNTFVNSFAIVNAASNTIPIPQIKAGFSGNKLNIEVLNTSNETIGYYFGLRKITSAYYDSIVYSPNSSIEILNLEPSNYYVSVAAVDSNRWMSMISNEVLVRVSTGVLDLNKDIPAIELFQNQPNPFDDFTLIPIQVNNLSFIKNSELYISNFSGQLIQIIPLQLKEGINEIICSLPNKISGEDFYYTLRVNGNIIQSRKMKFINF